MSDSQDDTPISEPTATPTNFPSPQRGHAVALAVTLSLVGVLLIAGITFFTVRMRRARSEQEQQGRDEENGNSSPRRSTVLDTRHPASHITPFSNHQPGTNMRIARRRVDGAWDFEDPESPFEPQGIADPSPHPLSASLSQRSTIRSNKTASNTECDHRRETDSSGVSRFEPPPPAYHSEVHSDEGYTNASRKG